MSKTNDPLSHTRPPRASEILPEDTLRSNILITGPTLSNKDTIAFDLLAESWASEPPPFVITATDTADQFRSRFTAFSPPNKRVEDLYVIDCTESAQNDSTTTRSCKAATPADLTGVGICLSKGYDEFKPTGGRVILLDNLSTFLVYSDVDRLSRFISTINNRATDLGDITVHLLDTDAINSETKHQLYHLFSTVIEVKQNDGETLYRVRGPTETTWTEYPAGGEPS